MRKKYKYYFIYKTTCLVNNKIYVGYHFTDNLNDGYIGNGIRKQKDVDNDFYFHNAVRKYGYSNFKRDILEFFQNRNEYSEKEKYWIKELNAHYTCGGYNMTWGGDYTPCFTDSPNKERWRSNMKKNHKGMTNQHHKKETKKKIGDGNRGKIHSEEQNQKNREYQTGRKFPEKSKQKHKETIAKLPVKTCEWCGYQSNNYGNIVKSHGNNCKQNPNYIPKEYIPEIVTCEWCGKVGILQGMKVWHLDNCKQNPNKKDLPGRAPYVYIKESIDKQLKSYYQRPLEVCPHCGYKSRNAGVLKRLHFDNCKYNPNRTTLYITKTKEEIEKQLESYYKRPIETCPNCGYQSRNGNIHRFHFNNCKYKPRKIIQVYREYNSQSTNPTIINVSNLHNIALSEY